MEYNWIFMNSKWMTNYFNVDTYTESKTLDYTVEARQRIKLGTHDATITAF